MANANSDAHPMTARDPEIRAEFGSFTTVNDAAVTVFAGCLAAAPTRTGEGTFTGVLKRKYKQLRFAKAEAIVAGGGNAVFTALDVTAGTFALLLSTNAGVASDLPGANVLIQILVANTTVTRR